jgi:formylmethanofuran dehydrogenase subunit B
MARGEEAKVESTLERAADLLGRARFPVFGGLFTDIAGAAAALSLAEKLGGVIDHAAGDGLMRMSQVMRERGASPASFGEVRNRADVIVVVGDGPLKRDPALIEKLLPEEKGLPRPGDHKREVIVLGAKPARVSPRVPLTSIEGRVDLPVLIARLGAAVAERGDVPYDRLAAIATRLREAAFAVFVFDAAYLDEPALFTVLDIVRQLSNTTRAATLALAAPGNGDGVNLCATWSCGLPVRTSFAGAEPEHDASKFATRRLIESGEADALVWIDALSERCGHRPGGVPTVVLASEGGTGKGADIRIEVACAGRDHDAALYLSPISGIGMVKATQPTAGKPSVASVLDEIGALIDKRRAA